jgi:hypothetical protein
LCGFLGTMLVSLVVVTMMWNWWMVSILKLHFEISMLCHLLFYFCFLFKSVYWFLVYSRYEDDVNPCVTFVV